MLRTFSAYKGQSVLDVCLNTYGNLDFLIKLMQDSAHTNIGTLPVSQQSFIYDDNLIQMQTIGQGVENHLYAVRDVYAAGDGIIDTLSDNTLIDSDGQAIEDSDNAQILVQ